MSNVKLKILLNRTIEDANMVEDRIARTDNDLLIEVYLNVLFYLSEKMETIQYHLSKGRE